MDIIKKLKALGYETIPSDFYKKVSEWASWCEGDVKAFHRYKVYNGTSHISCKLYSLQMAKKVAEDWANLLMSEKVAITAEGKKEQEFLDEVLYYNNFTVKANEMQELKASLGTVAYVPRVVGQSAEGAEAIDIDYGTIENIFPLRWRNGIVDECAFASSQYRGDKEYLYLTVHKRAEDKTYIIENRAYQVHNKQLREVTLEEVFGTAVPPVVKTGSKERQFVIDRLNIANNYDYTLPVGIPVFANAIDVLKGVDIAYDSYVNEFVLGKKRIMVQPAASKTLDGDPIFDPKDLAYYVLPEDLKGESVIKEIDMKLRTAEHNTGIQDQLNMLSSKCGFGENHYRFENGSVATATQVISENSTLFRNIKKHEIILEKVLEELCRILLRLGNAAMHMGLNEEVEISIDFDDSIIEDKAAEFSRDMQLLSAGILNDWEMRAKWLNEDEATAKASLPNMEELTTEEEDEVE